MSIIAKFKKLLKTPEARHLGEEVREQAGEVAQRAKEVAGATLEKGKEVAGDVRQRIQGRIDYETFKRTEIRLGTIVSVESVEKSDKLLKLMVDVGEEKDRQIISGIAPYFSNVQSLAGRQAMFVTNLEPRTIFGYESNGMILALTDEDSFALLTPDSPMTPGVLAS